jgi:type I restriction enzyme R subunit
MELYSALGETFDIADLEGTLTNVSEELKQLPSLHDGLWDLFKTLPNKKDEEAFEILLANSDLREDFYTRLSSYCRILKMALSSIQWVTDTPPDKIERYKQDAGFFQKLRASVKIRYAEEIDYRDYEKQIQKMLNTYVQADEVIQVVEPVNIFEREAFQAEVDKARSDRAKADIIANRTKKTITEKMDEDPFFYRKFASLLQQVIDDYKAQRISDAEYLKGVTDVMTQVRDGKTEEGPDILQNRDLSRALFGALKNELGSGSTFARDEPANYGSSKEKSEPLEKVLAEAACAMEDIIRDHAVVRWRENIDAQNRMRNDLDDFLYTLQKQKGVQLSFDQMDAIIEAVIRIAIHRNDDI